MATTQYKGWTAQVTGTNSNIWGDVLNDEMIKIADRNVGGIVPKTLGSSTVNLDATESQNLIVRLTGTLTANVLVTTLANGFQIVENLTSGAFAVTFQRNGVGSAVTIPQGTRALIALDATNGARVAADNQTEFPSGTTMVFAQAAAPTNWTKNAAGWNHALRLVGDGSGGTTGGTFNFTDVFTARGITGTVGNTTLDITQIPLHGHPFEASYRESSNTGCNALGGIMFRDLVTSQQPAFTGAPSTAPGQQIGGAGGGQAHTHTFTGTTLQMGVLYLNVIICTKS